MSKKSTNIKDLTYDEKILREVIIELRNELIGGLENMYLDEHDNEVFTNKECQYTKEKVVDHIYETLINCYDKYIVSSRLHLAVEKKHLYFLGTDFVKRLIADRVEAQYKKQGWSFPNNYEGK